VLLASLQINYEWLESVRLIKEESVYQSLKAAQQNAMRSYINMIEKALRQNDLGLWVSFEHQFKKSNTTELWKIVIWPKYLYTHA